ncbi:MAG: PAS domain-containing protein [Xanthomonadaceae bacterium]|nr:PAS domain-containing protein [Xanthomonadaceae bacterium]
MSDSNRVVEQVGPRLVAGIGASAGGLTAYTDFFRAIPPDSGLAFVLVQHLSPKHPSALAELIGAETEMPVVDASDGQELAANHIYVIPADATMTVDGSRLRVTRPRVDSAPIDTFLMSLAEEYGEHAVAIILSGFGSDGALGLAAVKSYGGITFAQAGVHDTEPLPGMPWSAFETGLVDHVLPVAEIAARLLDYERHLSEVKPSKKHDGARADVLKHIPDICRIIDLRLGHDFSQYKEGSIARRIQRRMQLHGIHDTTAYIAKLRDDREEVGLLFRDLLISVTSFFRDPVAFAALDRIVIPELVKKQEIRVWVPGCATGEEAYSIAILLREAVAGRREPPRITIFATDIDESAIRMARKGVYIRAQLEGLNSRQLGRWFEEDRGSYTVVPEIRELCVFSQHSILRDPSFSRLDLISCRNLLIYLAAGLQERVIPMFHFALRAGGFLFLGPSESVARDEDCFAALDERHRIYRRRERQNSPPRMLTVRPRFDSGDADARQPHKKRSALDSAVQRAAARFSPAYLVIDSQNRVVRFSGHTGRFLGPTEGPASDNLFDTIHHSLRAEVRDALRVASETQAQVLRSAVPYEANGESGMVRLIVEPIAQEAGEATHFVIGFHEMGPVSTGDDDDDSDVARDLRATRGRLRAAVDEGERANADLTATNQELQSVNEELRAAVEELQVSKEEMQSLNEELQTVNAELTSKNAIAAKLNSDLQNFLENTGGATLFLDAHLTVRTFTPSATEIFHLRDSDIGRPLAEVVCRLKNLDLAMDVRSVLEDNLRIEREVFSTTQVYLMRIRPYRSPANPVDGAVLSFTEITERKAREETQAHLAAIVASTGDAVLALDRDGIVTNWNRGAERLTGYGADAVIGKQLPQLLSPEGIENARRIFDAAKAGDHVEQKEMSFPRPDGSVAEVVVTVSPVYGVDGEVNGISIIARDNSEQIELEQHRSIMMAELDHRVKNTLATVQSIARQTGKSSKSVKRFLDAFDQRIIALARTHDLLTAAGGTGAMLQDLVVGELKPYESANITIDGEPVRLGGKSALALGMGIHELATNAAKHGALSTPRGRVSVSWKLEIADAVRTLHFNWKESGGPKVCTPEHRGFGSRLIEEGLRAGMGADVSLKFLPTGIHFKLTAPLDDDE